MTTTTDPDPNGTGTGAPTGEQAGVRPQRRAMIVLAAVAAAAVLLAGALIARAGDDDPGAWEEVRARCEQVAGSVGYDTGRCNRMVTWMADGHRDGRMAGPGPMMADGAMLRSACHQWMGGSGVGPQERDEQWCDAMAGAMPHGSMMPGR